MFPGTIEGCLSWLGRFRCFSFGVDAWSPVRGLSSIIALTVSKSNAFVLILGLQAFMSTFILCSADAGWLSPVASARWVVRVFNWLHSNDGTK